MDTDKSEQDEQQPGVSLLNLLSAADKLERLLYQEMAESVRRAVAVIANDHPRWLAEGKEVSRLIELNKEDRRG